MRSVVRSSQNSLSGFKLYKFSVNFPFVHFDIVPFILSEAVVFFRMFSKGRRILLKHTALEYFIDFGIIRNAVKILSKDETIVKSIIANVSSDNLTVCIYNSTLRRVTHSIVKKYSEET